MACHGFTPEGAAAEKGGVKTASEQVEIVSDMISRTIMLHAVEKKTAKTSKADIALAKARYKALAEDRKRKRK